MRQANGGAHLEKREERGEHALLTCRYASTTALPPRHCSRARCRATALPASPPHHYTLHHLNMGRMGTASRCYHSGASRHPPAAAAPEGRAARGI